MSDLKQKGLFQKKEGKKGMEGSRYEQYFPSSATVGKTKKRSDGDPRTLIYLINSIRSNHTDMTVIADGWNFLQIPES